MAEKEQSIDKFLVIDDTLVPGFEYRASVFEGHSQDCRFSLLRLRATLEMSKVQAEKYHKSHHVKYCWENCNITDCPVYKMNSNQKI